MARGTKTGRVGRITEITRVSARHSAGYLFDARPSWLKRRRDDEVVTSTRGQHLREMLDELGPTFVKFGQLLSTRPDVVPPDIVRELRHLQQDVTPFGFAEVEAVVEDELGLTLERAFIDFDERPVAAASIGQVHRAVTRDGRLVA
ncbi:MAG: AarF/UbiB family protein, partial [Gaiellales bacterium]